MMEITELSPKQKCLYDELIKRKLDIMSNLFLTGSIEYENSKKELTEIAQKLSLLLNGGVIDE